MSLWKVEYRVEDYTPSVQIFFEENLARAFYDDLTKKASDYEDFRLGFYASNGIEAAYGSVSFYLVDFFKKVAGQEY